MADKTGGLDHRQTLKCTLDDDQSAGREPISGTASALAWSEGTKHNEHQESRIMNTAELSAGAPLAKPASRSRADERGASTSGNVERRSFLKTLGTAGAALSASALAGTAAVAQANRAQISKGDAALLRFAAAAEIIESDLWLQYAELGGVQDDEV